MTDGPHRPGEDFQGAMSFHRQGRLREAEQLYQAVLKADRHHAGALRHLGVMRAQQGRLDEAIRLIRRALEASPGSAEVHGDLGVALEMAGRHGEAAAQYQAALALTPDDGDAHYNLGNALLALGQTEDAIGHYEQALAIRPGSGEAHNNLGAALHKLGRSEEAIACHERALTLKPGYAEAHNNLGVALAALDRNEQAVVQYEAALALKLGYAEAHYNLGNALQALGRHGEALRCFERALALKPDHAKTHNNLGNALQILNRPQEAIPSYERALALEPDYAEAHYNLGNALRRLDRLPEAVERYRRALALKPDFPDAPIARHFLAACSGEAPPRASDAYLRRVFDQDAAIFDTELARLGYRAPQLLVDAAASAVGDPTGTLDVLDAGCGTGLCGPLLRPFARHLAGIDLSEGMLAKARERKVYDDLVSGELTAFLADQDRAYDLILSADTFIYFGDLAAVMTAAAGALREEGVIAFSVERLDGDAGGRLYRLEPHGRYAHGEDYVRYIVGKAELVIVILERADIRIERGAPVAGLLAVARKRRSAAAPGSYGQA